MKPFTIIARLRAIAGFLLITAFVVACSTDLEPEPEPENESSDFLKARYGIDSPYDLHKDAWIILIDSNDHRMDNLHILERCDLNTRNNCWVYGIANSYTPDMNLEWNWQRIPIEGNQLEYVPYSWQTSKTTAEINNHRDLIHNADFYDIINIAYEDCASENCDANNNCDSGVLDSCGTTYYHYRRSRLPENEALGDRLKLLEFQAVHNNEIVLYLSYKESY